MDIKRYEQLRSLCNELEEYAELCHDESGETWFALATFLSNIDYVSETFAEAWATEVERIIAEIRERAEVVEEEIPRTGTYTIKKLKWRGEA
jgi:hypothetical protein